MARRGKLKWYARGLCFFSFAFLASDCLAAERTERVPMELTSSAIKEGQPIPAKYTCEGKDISPPLKWSGVPAAAKTLALVVDDPDAPVGDWFHWLVYNLPITSSELPEGQPKTQALPTGGQQGRNDFKRLGYGGPCPPPGKPHRYFFKLYALDAQLNLAPNVTGKELQSAMTNHILAEVGLMGTYERK